MELFGIIISLFLVSFVSAADSCFSCANTTYDSCFNYGSCNKTTGICSCKAGWGGLDCSRLQCDNLWKDSKKRTVAPPGFGCSCDAGWTGPNCHMCLNDTVCAESSNIGPSLFCNKNAVSYDRYHYSKCIIDDTNTQFHEFAQLGDLLDPDFVRQNATIGIHANALTKTILTSYFIGGQVMFSCFSSNCTQTYSKSDLNSTFWNCPTTNCSCVTVDFTTANYNDKTCSRKTNTRTTNITNQVNSGGYNLTLNCTSDSTCYLNSPMFFNAQLTPSALSPLYLTSCSSGECVSPLLSPLYSKPTIQFDAAGKAFVAVFSVLVASISSFIGWGLSDRSKKSKLPIPPDVPGASLTFDNISYQIGDKKILRGITGTVKQGEFLAIMGPSGSGKTSFLDILAKKRKRGTVSGRILVNGAECPDLATYRQITGYVDQEDIHLPELTVRETLEFSAFCRLPEAISLEEKKNRVTKVLEQLGLSHVAESRVGDASKRGLSGGEKKRLSIGVELVTNPPVLFVDEPTSGLDSHSALQVIKTLYNLALLSKKTIICTVHQPNSSIFNCFDQILLISKGFNVYYGPAKGAENFCADSNMPCPPSYHIADHLLDVAAAKAIIFEKQIQGEKRPKLSAIQSFKNSANDLLKGLKKSSSDLLGGGGGGGGGGEDASKGVNKPPKLSTSPKNSSPLAGGMKSPSSPRKPSPLAAVNISDSDSSRDVSSPANLIKSPESYAPTETTNTTASSPASTPSSAKPKSYPYPINKFVAYFWPSPKDLLEAPIEVEELECKASFYTQIVQVLNRSMKVFWRNPILFYLHLSLSIIVGVGLGALYFGVSNNIAGLQNRLGSFFFMLALMAFGGLSGISSLSKDRLLFMRERSNGFYGWAPYFVSKVVTDIIPLRLIPSIFLCGIPYYMIGFTPDAENYLKFILVMLLFGMNSGLHSLAISCMIADTATSTLVAVMSILFQMLFSGIVINQSNMPSYASWIQYLSFFKYVYEACIANEAGGFDLILDFSGIVLEIPAYTVLSYFGFDPASYWRNVIVTIGLFVFLTTSFALLVKLKLRERK